MAYDGLERSAFCPKFVLEFHPSRINLTATAGVLSLNHQRLHAHHAGAQRHDGTLFVLGAPRPGQAEHLPWLHDAWLATVKTRRRG